MNKQRNKYEADRLEILTNNDFYRADIQTTLESNDRLINKEWRKLMKHGSEVQTTSKEITR